jgi:hypothetical protein
MGYADDDDNTTYDGEGAASLAHKRQRPRRKNSKSVLEGIEKNEEKMERLIAVEMMVQANVEAQAARDEARLEKLGKVESVYSVQSKSLDSEPDGKHA